MLTLLTITAVSSRPALTHQEPITTTQEFLLSTTLKTMSKFKEAARTTATQPILLLKNQDKA